MGKFKLYAITARALVLNYAASARDRLASAYVDLHNSRLDKKKRDWTAVRVGGGGVVPLGKVSMKVALETVAKFGVVQYVDKEVAYIMYSDKSN